MPISLERAQQLIARAVVSGTSQSVSIAAVVVDEAGNIKASAMMDGTGFMSFDAALRKARTSANMGVSTKDVSIMTSKDPLMQAALHVEPGLLLLPGGGPIKEGDTVIGALGIAGGHYSQDQALLDYALSEK
ncbi:heme-binding protein [Parasphingorhabdus sp.]|uniref:GlcG/HbpS family heme-binding protein n=1 Tax=Parasphingorhabdus sp. TaxID=2709688 RepID=UPI0032F0615F